ncbi:MAG: hypothetical protein RL748_2150 [Pseudomonadota bacterium]
MAKHLFFTFALGVAKHQFSAILLYPKSDVNAQYLQARRLILQAKAYGPVRFANRERSKDAMDKLIAGHAIALDITLVTNNIADFVRYPGLRLENWVGAH